MTLQREYLGGETEHLHPTDADLVRRARRGDQAACRELVDRHAPYLYRLAFSLVGSAADAEDVVQETFSGAFRQLGTFAERSTVKTWLIQILVRQAARCHRSRRRHETVSLEPLSEGREGEPADVRMDVLAALDALAPMHREVVVLREMEGMSYEEIARALGIPRGTVESRLFRARQELKERLKDYLA